MKKLACKLGQIFHESECILQDNTLRKKLSMLDAAESKRMIRDLIYDNHAGYILMLIAAPKKKKRILYIGEIEGGVASCLAKHGHIVYVCSTQEKLLSLIAKRCSAKKWKNIHCINADIKNFPFSPNTFDLILLETNSFSKNSAQLTYDGINFPVTVKKCAGLLKDDGQYILLSGNAFSPLILARKIKKWFSLQSATDLTNETYRQLQKTVSLFSSTHFWGVDPKSGEFYPFVKDRCLYAGAIPTFMTTSTGKTNIKPKVKTLLTCTRFFTPAFAVVAGNKELKNNFATIIESVLANLQTDPQTKFNKPIIQSIINRKTQRIMIRMQDKSNPQKNILLKIPYGDWAILRESTNYSGLQLIHASETIPSKLKNKVPVPLFKETIEGYSVCGESFFVDVYPPSTPTSLHTACSEGLDFIFQLHKSTKHQHRLSGFIFDKLIMAPLQVIESFCYKDSHIRSLDIIQKYVQETLFEKTLPLVFVHGDFSAGNLLINSKNERLESVIDWETSAPQGLPVVDLFFLLLHPGENGLKVILDFIHSLLSKKEIALDQKRVLSSYLDCTHLSADYLPAICILFWASQIASRGMALRYNYDPIWLEKNIYSFLQSCSNIIQKT